MARRKREPMSEGKKNIIGIDNSQPPSYFFRIYITEIVEMIENDVVDDEENLLDSLKTNSAKLKVMAFQLRRYMRQR